MPVSARVPDDEYLHEQWYFSHIGALDAWDVTVGSRDVVVAVIDAGVDIDHPDLEDQIWTNAGEIAGDGLDNDANGFIDDLHGWDFVGNDSSPIPDSTNGFDPDAMNHGSLVAGVIGAEADNNEGVAGVAWRVRIMPIRILDGQGSGDTTAATNAVQYAIDNGADVINLSFTGFIFDQDLEDALRTAYRRGIFTVAALGNDDENLNAGQVFPACIMSPIEDWVFGVAALDEGDTKSDFSNYGSGCTDMSAPGEFIFGTLNYDLDEEAFLEPYDGYYAGTSVAAPMVSGAAVLLKAAFPTISVPQMQLALKLGADPVVTRGTYYHGELGPGRLNVAKALQVAEALLGSAATTGSSDPESGPQSIVLGSAAGAPPVVRVYGADGVQASEFFAYAESFLGGVRVATGDLTGDGVQEIVTGAGVGGGPQVRIFDLNGAVIGQFFAFDASLRGGVEVAVADGRIVVSDPSGSSAEIRTYDRTGALLARFVPFTTSVLGLSLATGDVDGDGVAEIIAATGAGEAPRVRVYESTGTLRTEFFAYAELFLGGVHVAVGDVDGDGVAEIVTGPRNGGGPQVRIFDQNGQPEGQFFAFDSADRLGVQVSVVDTNGDGTAEIVATEGRGGSSVVSIFDRYGNVGATFLAVSDALSI